MEFLKETSSQTRKMRYPAMKLTDCGKTCTLTKLQIAEAEKFEAKYVNLCNKNVQNYVKTCTKVQNEFCDFDENVTG